MTRNAYDNNKDYLAEIDRLLTEKLGDRAARVSQDDLDKLAEWPAGILDEYGLYQRYYDGAQGTLLTDRLKQYLERNARFEYNENYCEVIVETLVERLKVTGVTTSADASEKKPPEPVTPPLADGQPVPGEPGPGEGVPTGPQVPESFPKGAQVAPTEPIKPDLSDWLWQKVWDGSRGDQRQIDVYREAAIKGASFLIVDYDPIKDRPRLVRNGPETCRVIFKDGEKNSAIKTWMCADKSPTNPAGVRVKRLNIYRPDRIEKWFKLANAEGEADKPGGWVEWLDDGDSVWPIPWMDEAGEPLGIPVFRFGRERSEIRAAVPQQDRLNKELIDLSAVLDAQGFPQRHASGIENANELKSNPGEVWYSPNPEAKFGQFEAADPTGLLKSVESTIIRMADRSRTPRYLLAISGDAPSGEALKTAEAGLVAKCEDRQTYYGNEWSDLMILAAKVSHVYGSGKDAPPVQPTGLDEVSINVKWKDAQTRNEKEHLETLALMQTLGVPEEELWSRIPDLDVMAVREAKQRQDVENARLMMASFNRGGDTNPAVDGQGGPPRPPSRPPFGAPPA